MVAPKKRTKPVVKRKRKKNSGRKKKANFAFSSFAASIRNVILWAILITIVFLLLLFLYDYYYPQEKEEEVKTEQNIDVVSPDDSYAETEAVATAPFDSSPDEKRTTLALAFENGAELPRLVSDRKEQVLAYEGYTVSYNIDHKLANWVAWELTAEEASSTKVRRSDEFVSDPALRNKTAQHEDYSGSGYDRGHLAPAGDMKWSTKAMQESFYFSNICPQNSGLNAGIWNSLEQKSRNWASTYESVLIITGPVIEDGLRKIGRNKVSVPNKFYKVIATIAENEYQGIAFLFENREYQNTSLKTMAIPIDSVEKVTGIDFFHILPTEYERVMESSVDLSYWFK